MKPSNYETPDTGDLDLEAHVALLVGRMACDLHAMYEPPDLSTPQTAAQSTATVEAGAEVRWNWAVACDAISDPQGRREAREWITREFVRGKAHEQT